MQIQQSINKSLKPNQNNNNNNKHTLTHSTMKAIFAGCLPTDHQTSISATPSFIKITAVFILSISLFFLVKRFTLNTFTITNTTTPSQQHEYRLAFYTNITTTTTAFKNSTTPSPPLPSPLLSLPPPPPAGAVIQRTGIVDENGTMTDHFMVGEFDEALVDSVVDVIENEKSDEKREKDSVEKIKIKKFKVCGDEMRDYIPCLDSLEAVNKLNSSDRGEKFERHCPERGKGLDCLVPKPKGYKQHIPWPKSRDEVQFDNVPLTGLIQDKGGQNWIARKKGKVIFPVGGIQFIHHIDQYLDQISKMVPEIAFGKRTRVALDIGCGIANFGAYLMKRNVTTLSIAPKDVHDNRVQIALERGVPAMVAAFATRRLLYPSQAFDLIHCSECKINWTRDDGILLLEVNRMLRAGRYFVWAAEAVGKHESDLVDKWKEMENLARSLCWELVKKEGFIAIWQKPLNNTCYLNRSPGVKPSVCNEDDNLDNVWYVDLKSCISQLPGDGYGSNVTTWPDRLHHPPDRLLTIKMDADTSRKEIFRADSNFWNEMADGYVRVFRWKTWNLRNVMDMKAGYGGFATALHDLHVDCWVMNVVPVSGSNTLPLIYDRGLIGVSHDWCEPFDTYPRTYDLLYAAELLSAEQKRKRCNISTIMLEMDRILRPGGRVFVHDFTSTIDEVEEIAKALGWTTWRGETGNGPYAVRKLLYCTKPQ